MFRLEANFCQDEPKSVCTEKGDESSGTIREASLSKWRKKRRKRSRLRLAKGRRGGFLRADVIVRFGKSFTKEEGST